MRMERLLFAILCVSLSAGPSGAEDLSAVEIIRRSVSRDFDTWERARNYICLERHVEHRLDGKRRVKSTEITTYEVLILFGEPYRRLVARDDRPISEKEARKEEDKLARLTAERQRETEIERRKRAAEFDKRRQRGRAFLREIPEAFDLRLAGEEVFAGRPVYVIEGVPKPGYRARESMARMLPKFRGKLWIDKEDYNWVKLEAESIDTVSFGLLLARLAKGSRVEFEQFRVASDELWLPRRVRVNVGARIALVKKISADIEVTYSDYRKFQADSRIVSTSIAPVEEPPLPAK